MDSFHDFQIEKQRVFLMEDFAGIFAEISGSQIEYVFLDHVKESGAEIYVNETELDELRVLDSKTPVYGIWQTVLFNGLVDLDNSISIIELNDDGGYYLITRARDSGGREIVRTGVVKGGMLVGYDLQIDYHSLPRINVDFKNLRLPGVVAKTKSEKYADQKAKVVNQSIATGLVCVGIFIAAFFLGMYFDTSKKNLEIERARLQAEIEKNKSDLETLKKRKLVDKKSNIKLLDSLAVLLLLDDGIETPKTTSKEKKPPSFSSKVFYVVSNKSLPENPFKDSKVGKSNINIDGRYVIEVVK